MANTNPTARPTHVRYVVIALTTMVAVLLYVDRICLSYAERYVREDLGLSNDQMSWVMGSFFLTYALAQLPAGWLSDRFGARLMLGLYLALWSLCTGLMGLAESFVILIALRLGCGLFEAGGYPAAAGIVRNWMPFERRGLASGIVSVGGRLGGALAPLLTALLIVAFVPVSSSSLLEPEDILDANFVSTWTLSSQVNDSSALYQLSHRVYLSLSKSAQSQKANSDATKIDCVTKAGNQCLADANFLEGIDLSGHNLPAEAVRLLNQTATPLTPEEIQRRNRLVLETVFPEAIRKVYGQGWRPVMWVYGIAGIIIACVFWLLFRTNPRGHPGCNEAEIALIEGAEGFHDRSMSRPSLPFLEMITSGGLWASSLVQFFTNIGWAFLITWFPGYLAKKYYVPPITLGLMTSLPIFVGMAGMFWGGWLTDFWTRLTGKRWGRAGPLALTRFAVAGAFAISMFIDAPWELSVAMAMVALATDLGTPAIWAYCMDIGGKHVGSVLGWSNMWGNLGAFISPILLNKVLEHWGSAAMFLVCASAMLLAGVFGMFLDGNKRIDASAELRQPEKL